MTTLYHGCVQEKDELHPGLDRFLYASKNKEGVLFRGFLSQLRQLSGVLGVRHVGHEIVLDVEQRPTWGQIKQIDVFLYAIKFDPNDGWMKNSECQNDLAKEWRTTHVVRRNIVTIERFPTGKLMLVSKKFIFNSDSGPCQLSLL